MRAQITADNRRVAELSQLIATRNQKLLTITKQTGQTGKLTAAGLAQIDNQIENLKKIHRDEEVMTEFSVVTDESEIAP